MGSGVRCFDREAQAAGLADPARIHYIITEDTGLLSRLKAEKE